jgi:hypothetical protein
MTDIRSFKPVMTSFEETWPRHDGAALVALALQAADWLMNRRGSARRRSSSAGSPPRRSLRVCHFPDSDQFGLVVAPRQGSAPRVN